MGDVISMPSIFCGLGVTGAGAGVGGAAAGAGIAGAGAATGTYMRQWAKLLWECDVQKGWVGSCLR